METSKAIELAKKLQALAEQGVGGEATNAANRLEALLAKHNLTIDDLDKPERHICEYDIMLKHQDLFFQLVFNTVLNWDGKFRYGKSKRKIRLMLTNAEQLELTAKFDHYVRLYDQHLKLFLAAFIHKNRLYAKHDENYKSSDDNKSSHELSEADKEILYGLMSGIVNDDYKKRLTNK